jgi:hypothetical protein
MQRLRNQIERGVPPDLVWGVSAVLQEDFNLETFEHLTVEEMKQHLKFSLGHSKLIFSKFTCDSCHCPLVLVSSTAVLDHAKKRSLD